MRAESSDSRFSPWSSSLTITTAALPAPAGLSVVRGATDNTTAEISWSNNGAGLFYLEERSENQDGFTQVGSSPITADPSGTTSYEVTGLDPALKYYFRVRSAVAVDGSSTKDYSSYSPVTSTTIDGSLGSPTGLTAVVTGPDQIDLTWSNPAHSPATSVVLESSTDGTTFTPMLILSGTDQTYDVANLMPATTYWFRVRLGNDGGLGDPSEAVSATTLAFAAAGSYRDRGLE